MLTNLRRQILQYDESPNSRTVLITFVEQFIETNLPKVEEAIILTLDNDIFVEGALDFIGIYISSFNKLKYEMINNGIEEVLKGDFQTENAEASARLTEDSQKKIVQFLQDGEAVRVVMQKIDDVVQDKLPIVKGGPFERPVANIVGMAKNRIGAFLANKQTNT